MSPFPAQLPFVGRVTLLRRLQDLHRTNQHVLLLGRRGTGKSRIIAEMARDHPLLVVPHCDCLGRVMDAIESLAGLERGELKMAARVQRAIACLAKTEKPVVFENVARVPPKVAHFIRILLAQQPVWLVARSTQAADIGHVWPFLFFFKQVEVPSFAPRESLALLATVDLPGEREDLLGAAPRLHRLAAGHPATLAALIAEMQKRRHDLRSAEGIRILATHARITETEAAMNNKDSRP